YQPSKPVSMRVQWYRAQSWGFFKGGFYRTPANVPFPIIPTNQHSNQGLFANGQNQKGFDFAATVEAIDKFEVQIGLDYAQRLLPSYNQKHVEHRHRLSLRTDWQPTELISIKNVLQFQKNETSEETQKIKTSTQIKLQPTHWLRFRSRLLTHYNRRNQPQLNKPTISATDKLESHPTRSFGTLFYHELRIHKAVKKSHSLTIDMRWTQFNILDYDARIYTYEQDLRYAFHIPMWQGQGNQWYVLSTLSIGQHLSVQFKYSVRNYPDTSIIGSGLNQTRGSIQQVIKAQVLVRW
ncbi:MAG: DUF481 domain-containing protein, partial [Bacteroidetes bacterium]|nr:DUF481 domain-containing protein [Bacteroidota bacterium]